MTQITIEQVREAIRQSDASAAALAAGHIRGSRREMEESVYEGKKRVADLAIAYCRTGGWWPIESCPKDDVVVLFYITTPYFGNPYAVADAISVVWEDWIHYGYAIAWQPLPAAPDTKDKQNG